MSNIFDELLSDETRSTIFRETMRKGECTTNDYLEVLDIARSTLSHHLSKLVEAEILEVRVAATGRPTKYWSIKPKMLFRKQIIKDPDKLNSDELLELIENEIDNQLSGLSFLMHLAREFTVETSDNVDKKQIDYQDGIFKYQHTNGNSNIFFPLKLQFTSEGNLKQFSRELNKLYNQYFAELDEETATKEAILFFGGFSLASELKFEIKKEHRS